MSARLSPVKPATPPSIPEAFARELESHRAALTGHCYRMLGSAADADDAVQETMVRGWRHLEQFEGRSAMRTWLYRIATRVCLDMLDARTRRLRPFELPGPGSVVHGPFTQRPAAEWIEPISDELAIPADCDPSEALALRQSIRLAFVAALQHLPPKQRAVLLLMEVLGWSAAEVAESLETTVAAVNSAIQRARATLAARNLGETPVTLTETQSSLLARYVEAFERYDLDALTSLLHEDAQMSMPPWELWLQGRQPIRDWMFGPGAGCRGSRVVPVSNACGLPAFGQYRPSGPGGRHEPWALIVLEPRGDRIAELNFFLDTDSIFPRFGLPAYLDQPRE